MAKTIAGKGIALLSGILTGNASAVKQTISNDPSAIAQVRAASENQGFLKSKQTKEQEAQAEAQAKKALEQSQMIAKYTPWAGGALALLLGWLLLGKKSKF